MEMCIGIEKLTGIRLVPVELEIGRETATESAQAFQQFAAPRLARYTEPPAIRDVDFDLVAFLELECFDDSSGQTDRETVSPLGNSHGLVLD
jgi:hypothetical protein